jgi:hypothetical protein
LMAYKNLYIMALLARLPMNCWFYEVMTTRALT